MSFTPAEGPTPNSSFAVQEKAKLRKVLRRVDLVLFATAAIITLETLAATASSGGQAIVWLLVTLFIFFVPYSLIMAELGSTFPLEGGPYEWPRRAFGRLAGSMTSLFYWIAQPVWLGGLLTATAVAAINSLIVQKPLGTAAEIIFGIVFVWVVIGGVIIAVKYGKSIPNTGAILKFVLTLLFVGLAIAFLVTRGKPSGTLTPSGLAPSLTGFLALVGILLYNWTGQELAMSASEEMVNPRRDIPRMVLMGGALTVVTYVLFILFILLVIPASALTNVSSFTDTLSHVNVVLGSATSWTNTIIGVLVVLVLLSEGVAWIMGSDRVQAVAAIDGAAPAWMRKFTSFGTPIAVNLTSGVIATVFVVLGFIITSGKLAAYFSVMLGLAISTSTISLLLMIPSLLVLRRKYPGLARPFRVPGGTPGAVIAVVLAEGTALLTCLTFLWPGLVNSWFGQSYSINAAYGVSRTLFETTTFVTLGVVTVIGLAFWAIGQRDLKLGRVGEPDLITELGVAEAAGGAAPTS